MSAGALTELSVRNFGRIICQEVRRRIRGDPAVDGRPSVWGESSPKFVTKPSRVEVWAGETGRFSVRTSGRPTPLVSWLKGGVRITSEGRVHVYQHSGLHFLEIQEVSVEDAESYTCSLTNSVGTITATAQLIVK
ncbi:hypothetical protein CRUP_031593, partial [Coryphaenoides rupestris]